MTFDLNPIHDPVCLWIPIRKQASILLNDDEQMTDTFDFLHLLTRIRNSVFEYGYIWLWFILSEHAYLLTFFAPWWNLLLLTYPLVKFWQFTILNT